MRYQTCNLDARHLRQKSRSPVNCQRQMQASKCRSLSKKLLSAPHEWVAFWWHLRWLVKSWSPFNEGREYLTIAKLPQCYKHTGYPHQSSSSDVSHSERYQTKALFGTSDQGQMLDMWSDIQQMSTPRCQWQRRHHLNRQISLRRKISLDRNQCNDIRSYR